MLCLLRMHICMHAGQLAGWLDWHAVCLAGAGSCSVPLAELEACLVQAGLAHARLLSLSTPR